MFRGLIQTGKGNTECRFMFDEVVMHHHKGLNWLVSLSDFFTPSKVRSFSPLLELAVLELMMSDEFRVKRRSNATASGRTHFGPGGSNNQTMNSP